MEDRDVEQILQLRLDPKTVGARDILQIDAAEGRADVADDLDEGVGVLGGDLNVEGVEVGEAFEQDRLSLHHRFGGESAEIAQAEDGRSIGDHADEVALGGVVVGGGRIVRDGQNRRGHAGRIG